jgi:hypothetical protein
MQCLATDLWSPRNAGDFPGTRDRIDWCVASCWEYFCQGGLIKLLTKDLKRLEYGSQTIVDKVLISHLKKEDIGDYVLSQFPRPWSLLDVGSCYNPFSTHSEVFNVTAVDIAPACESVLQCDFLNVKIEPVTIPNEPEQVQFFKESFDIVVFSLLLSYFPSPRQRLKCCINAFHLLKLHGVLLIITPDSSHQNKNMAMVKSWQWALEEIGLNRWKYTKLRHLHCMGFRKSRVHDLPPSVDVEELAASVYIPQDLADCSKDLQREKCKTAVSESMPIPKDHETQVDEFEELPGAF